MEEIVENMNFADDNTSFSPFASEDHFEFGGKGKARRAARQEAKVEKKAARTEKKLAKADLRRSKGEAKIIAAQNGTKSGVGAAVGSVLGGIASAIIPGAGSSSQETASAETSSTSTGAEAVDTASAARTAADTTTAPDAQGGGMSKKMKMGLYIGGGVLLVGVLALVFFRPKKTA